MGCSDITSLLLALNTKAYSMENPMDIGDNFTAEFSA